MKLEPRYTLRGNTILIMLREVQQGANPDLVYLEMVANARREPSDQEQ